MYVFFPIAGYYRTLNILPGAPQRVLVYLFYISWCVQVKPKFLIYSSLPPLPPLVTICFLSVGPFLVQSSIRLNNKRQKPPTCPLADKWTQMQQWTVSRCKEDWSADSVHNENEPQKHYAVKTGVTKATRIKWLHSLIHLLYDVDKFVTVRGWGVANREWLLMGFLGGWWKCPKVEWQLHNYEFTGNRSGFTLNAWITRNVSYA